MKKYGLYGSILFYIFHVDILHLLLGAKTNATEFRFITIFKKRTKKWLDNENQKTKLTIINIILYKSMMLSGI